VNFSTLISAKKTTTTLASKGASGLCTLGSVTTSD